MIIRFLYEGGFFFMSLVYLMWIIVMILTARFILVYRSSKDSQKLKKTNNSILFIGSLAFLIGITGQMVGFMAAFDSIQQISNDSITPYNLAGGFKVTFIAPFFGMMLLIISAIIWYVFRNLKEYPSQKEKLVADNY